MKIINIFWFKRDLRLYDNDAFNKACSTKEPLLLLYIFEPSLFKDPHYSERHWRFISESLEDLNAELASFNTKIHIVNSEVLTFFTELTKVYNILNVFSTNESGLDITYQRDKRFLKFCESHDIIWNEYQNGGVIRGKKNRTGWSNAWYRYMSKPITRTHLERVNFYTSTADIFSQFKYENKSKPDINFQKGGRSEGKKWENSFFNDRIQYYSEAISKPLLSRMGCSRLSPYFAWGCLSIREVYQRSQILKASNAFKKNFTAFNSRLRWQAHFIQKFEMEPRIEFEPFNKGYLNFEYPINENYVEKWKSGNTGYPLIDACMRALKITGYVNFRMRSMCVSFLVHHLFQYYAEGSAYLASLFLDFEPGIHYAQFQMQAGLTATNTVRVYNPTKNATDHDPEALFIKKFVPELSNLPAQLAIEPWNITTEEEEQFQFNYGVNYPLRIVNIQHTRKEALSKLYRHRKSELVQKERSRILEVHTIKRKA